MTTRIPVVVIRDGAAVRWHCDVCPEAGTGLDALYAHHLDTGHDPFTREGA